MFAIHTNLDIFNIIPVKRSCVEICIVIILALEFSRGKKIVKLPI